MTFLMSQFYIRSLKEENGYYQMKHFFRVVNLPSAKILVWLWYNWVCLYIRLKDNMCTFDMSISLAGCALLFQTKIIENYKYSSKLCQQEEILNIKISISIRTWAFKHLFSQFFSWMLNCDILKLMKTFKQLTSDSETEFPFICLSSFH